MASTGSCTNQTEWLQGHPPHPSRAMALVKMSHGRLSLEAIYRHGQEVRDPAGDARGPGGCSSSPRVLSALGPLAYAVVNAINNTAKRIQEAERRRVEEEFTVRKKEFIRRQAAIIKPFASVRPGRAHAEIMVGQEPRLLLSAFQRAAVLEPFTPSARRVAEPVVGGASPWCRIAVAEDISQRSHKLRSGSWTGPPNPITEGGVLKPRGRKPSVPTRKQSFWWLGFNNRLERDRSNRVVLYSEIRRFLEGWKTRFVWPERGMYKRYYSEMTDGDKAILWMGHDKEGLSYWGIWGFVTIHRTSTTAPILLESDAVLDIPIPPYQQGAPRGVHSRTVHSDFLFRTLGEKFEPLFDTYSWLGYIRPRRSIITVFPVTPCQYHAVRSELEREAA